MFLNLFTLALNHFLSTLSYPLPYTVNQFLKEIIPLIGNYFIDRKLFQENIKMKGNNFVWQETISVEWIISLKGNHFFTSEVGKFHFHKNVVQAEKPSDIMTNVVENSLSEVKIKDLKENYVSFCSVHRAIFWELV